MPMPRVLILFNEPTLPASHPDADSEHDILYTADVISKAVQEAGLPVSRLGITDDPAALLAGLKAAAPDVVFNLYEGTAGWGSAEAYVAGLLELLRIPFTGCPTKPLLLCRSKPLTKQLLAGAGLPTAKFMVVEREPVPACTLPWPVIVKPGLEDASVGIDQKSVVTSQAELEARVAYLRKTYGPTVLVEEFVRGREFNVAVWERDGVPTPLPFSEILFVPPADAPDLWPIVSFDAKWRPGTRDFVATPAKNPADVTPELRAELADLAVKAFELVGCRDYARIDFRVDEAGRPFILEINPNPCISPLAGLAAGLETAKIPYPEFALGVIRSALLRGPNPELATGVPTRKSECLKPDAHTADLTLETRRLETVRKYRVRSAKRTELDAIAGILGTAEAFNRDERQRLLDRLSMTVGRRVGGRGRVLLAVADGLPVGVAWVRPTDDGHGGAVLELIAVAAGSARSGVGRQLLAAAEREAASLGGRILLAELPSAPWYGSARQFLTRVGFVPTGEVPEFYRDGCARMSYAKPLPVPPPPAVAPAPVVVESAAAGG